MTENQPFYYWKNNEVITVIDDDLAYKEDITDLYCVDSAFSQPKNRYGRFTAKLWEHISIERFPKEFRTALLLLGIT